VNVNHGLIVKTIGKEVNNNLKSSMERPLTKERPIMNAKTISIFIGAIYLFKKDNVHQKDFVKNLGLLIIKSHLPIQVVDSIWLKHLVM
jgi:hypothetical protein